MKVITRFAPSPTGYLHVGNARAAIINWLYARKYGGEFILRFDDTDLGRSSEEYKNAITEDLKWLGLHWDYTFTQSSRIEHYNKIKQLLINKGRLYPCFESPEELEIKRKLQLANNMPPIYDRSSRNLSEQQIADNINAGKLPHYRFLVQDEAIKWHDLIKEDIKYEGSNLSDPIVVREDGSMTYMLCSVIDDIDYEISHILRGEDHVSNTAIQIQMFNALGKNPPIFGHFSLIKSSEEKISKRAGGFSIDNLRKTGGFEPMAINNFFSTLGTSKAIMPYKDLTSLVEHFEVSSFSKSPTSYLPSELDRLNHKLIISLEFEEVRERLLALGIAEIDKDFWLAVRPNLQKLSDIRDWWRVCYCPERLENLDRNFLKIAADLLPAGEITFDSWAIWISNIQEATKKKGKEVFLPLRLALTGMDHGFELKNLLPLIGREEIVNRLTFLSN